MNSVLDPLPLRAKKFLPAGPWVQAMAHRPDTDKVSPAVESDETIRKRVAKAVHETNRMFGIVESDDSATASMKIADAMRKASNDLSEFVAAELARATEKAGTLRAEAERLNGGPLPDNAEVTTWRLGEPNPPLYELTFESGGKSQTMAVHEWRRLDNGGYWMRGILNGEAATVTTATGLYQPADSPIIINKE